MPRGATGAPDGKDWIMHATVTEPRTPCGNTLSRPGGVIPARAPASGLAELFREAGPARHVQPRGTILLHGEPTDALYRVDSGTVRCCTIDAGGHRQIFRFARSGEYLGFVDRKRWHFTAEAVDHVILRAVPRAAFEQALAEDAALRLEVHALVARQLEERERQLSMLVHLSAKQRLLHFLVAFAANRRSDAFAVLPMTRQDLGDHLGLTLETVSRSFGALKRDGAIEMRGNDRFRIVAEPPDAA